MDFFRVYPDFKQNTSIVRALAFYTSLHNLSYIMNISILIQYFFDLSKLFGRANFLLKSKNFLKSNVLKLKNYFISKYFLEIDSYIIGSLAR